MSAVTYRADFVDAGGGKSRKAIRTGSTWKKTLTMLYPDTHPTNPGQPIPISGWTNMRMVIRPYAGSDEIIWELNQTNGGIAFVTPGDPDSDGKILLTIPEADTATFITWVDEEDEGSLLASYDFKYTEGGVVKDLIEGNIEIRASNTR